MERSSSEKQEIIDEVVGFNIRKLWTTCKDLTLYPGDTVANYCDGSRSKYLSPITYYLLCYGLNFFLAKLLGVFNYNPLNGSVITHSNNMLEAFMTGIKLQDPSITNERIEKIINIVSPAFEFLSSKEGLLLTSLPVFIVMQWLFFKSFRKPFLHHVYFLLFISAQINLMTIPLLLPLLFTYSFYWTLSIGTIVLATVFYFYAELKFYPRITMTDIFWRTTLQIITGIIPYFIWLSTVLLISIFILRSFSG